MTKKHIFVPPVEEMIERHRVFEQKIAAINKKNEELIKYWNSIPWWKFWAKPSFEEQRSIIMNNWSEISD